MAALVAAAWLAWRWRGSWPFPVVVVGQSMAPALQPGDFLVAVTPRSGGLRRGALVVVEHPRRPGFEMVKRLDGLPGDRRGGILLGPDEFWVLGEPGAPSTDSRSLGPVGSRGIRGVVVFRYWPPARLGFASRGVSSRPSARSPGLG